MRIALGDVSTFISIYLIVWWLVFMMALPVGVKVPEKQEEGHATSAPANPQIRKKMLITSIISIFLTGILMVGFQMGWEQLFIPKM